MKNKKSSPDDTTSGVKTEREYSNSGTDKERRSLVGPTTRRRFLTRVGLGATLLALGGQVYAFFRSLVPNVLYEDPQRFKVGTPDQFGEGARFLEDKRLFIFRQRNTFYAISAACTPVVASLSLVRAMRSPFLCSHPA